MFYRRCVSDRPSPRFRFERQLLAGALIALALVPVSGRGSEPIPVSLPSTTEWSALSLWQRLARCQPFLSEPDVLLEFTDDVLRADPDDLIARFLRARAMAEAGVADARIVPSSESDTPGDWMAVAALHEMRDQADAWRESVNEAAAAYRRAGRDDDAFFALLLRSRFLAGDRRRESLDATLAEIRAAAEASGDSLRIAEWLLREGAAQYSRNYGDSLEPRREAVRLLRRGEPGHSLATALAGLGNTVRRLDRLEESLELYREGLDVARAVGAPDVVQDCELGMGLSLRRLGDPRGALDAYREAARYSAALHDVRRQAIVTINFRPLYHQLGQTFEARRAAEEAVELCRRHGLDKDLAAALDGLGSEEALLGRLDDAHRTYEEAIRAAREHGTPGQLVFLWLHLADVLYELEDNENALDAVAQGLEAARDVDNGRGEVLLEAKRAEIEQHRGNVNEALEITEALLSPGRRVDARTRQLVTRTRARGLAAAGRRDEALALYHALITTDPDEDPLALAREQAEMGLLLVEAGRVKEAIPELRSAVDRLESVHDRSFVHTARLYLGQALARAGRSGEALPLLEQSLERVEEINSGLTVGQERADHFGRWYEGYLDLARTQVRLGREADAFRTLERSRARELRRALDGGPVLTERIDAERAKAIRDVEAELRSLQSSLVHEYSLEPEARRPDLGHVIARVDELERARDDFVHRIELESAHLARQAGLLPPVTLDALQRALAPGAIVLSTMTGESGSLVLEIRRTGVSARDLPWRAEELRALVEHAVDEIRGFDPGDESALRALAGPLLSSIDPHTPPSVVYVLPDGPLHRLPFEALPLGDGGDLLIDRSEVCYAASATLLADRLGDAPPVESPGPCRLLAFGDPQLEAPGSVTADHRGGLPSLRPLPHARREVLELDALFPGACVRVGAEATESAFFREARRVPVVHVAAHAFVDDSRPAYSGIVLATEPGSAEDGIVQAFEVGRATISADLVTLSACDTGRGHWLRGEGLLGLARAFRIAGARSLLVSLWDVDDMATATFMTDFYRRVLDGLPLQTALRDTKLAFRTGSGDSGESGARGVERRRRGVGFQVAGSWAAFVLIGPGNSPYAPR